MGLSRLQAKGAINRLLMRYFKENIDRLHLDKKAHPAARQSLPAAGKPPSAIPVSGMIR